MDTKPLTIKHTFQTLRFTDMSKRAVFYFASIPMSAKGHFGEVVLVQEFTGFSFHAQVAEPVAADYGAEPGVVFCGCHYGFGFFSCCEHGSCFAVGEWV